MDGVEIISHLLRSNAAMIAVVPAENIKGGALGDGDLGILVRSVSLVDWQPLAAEATVHSTERVSATIRAKTYREQRAAIKLIRRACAGVIAAQIGEARGVAVLTAGLGPEVGGPGNTFERAQFFRVSFEVPA